MAHTDEDKVEELTMGFGDILSSGQGEGFTNWHRNELSDLVKDVPEHIRKAAFEAFYDDAVGMETIDVSEIKHMMQLCGFTSFSITFTV